MSYLIFKRVLSIWHSVVDLNADGEGLDLVTAVVEEDDLLFRSVLDSVGVCWKNVLGAALLALLGSINDQAEGCVGSGLILQLPAVARGLTGASVLWHFESSRVAALKTKEIVFGTFVAENELRLRWVHGHGHGAKSSSRGELFHHCCCWLFCLIVVFVYNLNEIKSLL